MNQKSKSSSSSSDHDSEPWLAPGVLAGSSAAAAAAAYAVISTRQSWRFRRQVLGIIPARFASSRFPGKPLVPILGKPMIQRTWERAKLAATLNKLVVATDDQKIAECCSAFGADVLMTSESCKNGTERCNEALQRLQRKFDIVVNIQGDEPLIEPEIIDGVVKALQASSSSSNFAAPDAVFSTAVTSLKPEDALDPNRVKCVVDTRGYAIYFSRGLIPYNKSGKVNLNFPYLLHLGIQSYDAKFLRKYPELSSTPLQEEEDLEQLKILEHGYKMKVIKVDHEAHGVDTPEDVDKIESLMRQKNLS
ncbi:3-deoxy-manno-octulosonate cytidylyltransferase [Morus notabilis]|uniref:3-deoxy-manno-octulosonate cytidylyltransferase n=1 Tax=Morus notabilis TaxID=981085 RepID=W9RYU8_9ROSA|nr:3-deoxy-manno-octulosonate cytidylyltransferase [Morus notabilis]